MELLQLTCFIIIIGTFSSTSGQVCFKKFVQRKNKCKGPIRKNKYGTASACCSSKKGVGFAVKKERRGRNLYLCSPCEELVGKRPEKLKPKHKKKDKDNKKETPEQETIGWTSWGACSVTCGAGWRSRVKLCDSCVGTDPRNMKVEPCIEKHYCPVDGNWGPWYPWQSCSASCNGGKQARVRHCNYPRPSYGGESCQGEGDAQRECNMQSCPVDGNWGEWSRFSTCSVTCGKGTMTRTRLCNNPEPHNGGKSCPGSRFEQRRCTNRLCPVHGGWSLWGEWSTCSVTCGSGSRSRTRKCDSPKPRHGGKDCTGASKDNQKCKSSRPCPVNGGWSSWTSYAPCDAVRCSGKTGHRIRTRSCTNPRPRFGGRFCKGIGFVSVECINDEGCPVHGEWCRWSEWSPCIATCKSLLNHLAYERRERTCSCPFPKNGGNTCNTDEATGFEVRECEDVPMCDYSWLPRKKDDSVVKQQTKSSRGCRRQSAGSGDGSDVTCDQEESEEADDDTDVNADMWSGSGVEDNEKTDT